MASQPIYTVSVANHGALSDIRPVKGLDKPFAVIKIADGKREEMGRYETRRQAQEAASLLMKNYISHVRVFGR
jgi:hypothetical protein